MRNQLFHRALMALITLSVCAAGFVAAAPESRIVQRKVVTLPKSLMLSKVNDQGVGAGASNPLRPTPVTAKLSGTSAKIHRLTPQNGLAYSLNNAGVSVGVVLNGEKEVPVVFRANGATEPISTAVTVWPSHINDSGIIVGEIDGATYNTSIAARVIAGNVEIYLDTRPMEPGYRTQGSTAIDIASDGTTLVQLYSVRNKVGIEVLPRQVILWHTDGTSTPIAEDAWGSAISDNGRFVVGIQQASPIRWEISGSAVTTTHVTEPSGATYTYGIDINNTGAMVGEAEYTAIYWPTPGEPIAVTQMARFKKSVQALSAISLTNKGGILVQCRKGTTYFQSYLRP
ncbi:MAG TPA: hypothetical protein VGE59_00735 [Patescibacteria group bacterium]